MSPIRLIIVLLIVWAASQSMPAAESFMAEASRPSPLKTGNRSTAIYELQARFNRIYELYKDSVVFIATEKSVATRYPNPFDDPFFKERNPGGTVPEGQKRRGLGTGFIITSDGYICTNHHVVAQVDRITVKVNDREYRATIVGSDALTDIALLKIDGGASRFKPVYLGNSDSVKIGDMAVAIGNPFGLDKTITTGIVSATGRTMLDDLGNSHIQTDASINPGNSGGPLINLDGEVIGVNRMIYSQTGGNLGISFSIPVNQAGLILQQLKRYGKVKRGFIGVSISPLSPALARELGLEKPEGALVGSLAAGGPAEKAGIRIRDVITRINGTRVVNFRDLIHITSQAPIGSTATVVLWREKREMTVRVMVQERP